MSTNYTVRVPCTVETDAVCPTLSGPGDPTEYIVRNFTNVGILGFNSPSLLNLSLTDIAKQLATQHMWIPWPEALWRLQGNHARSATEACSNEVGRVHLDPNTTDLEWLKIRMWQVPSIQPQRCAIAPTVCLTDY